MNDPFGLQQADMMSQQGQSMRLQPQPAQNPMPQVDPQVVNYYRQMYDQYAGHPQMQNAVVQELYKVANPMNNQNSLQDLLNMNLGGLTGQDQSQQSNFSTPDVYGLQQADMSNNSQPSATQNNQNQPTQTNTDQSTQQDQLGHFGFGIGNGELFGQGGLVSSMTQPIRQGLINPLFEMGQTAAGTANDLLQGKPLTVQDNTNDVQSSLQQLQDQFKAGKISNAQLQSGIKDLEQQLQPTINGSALGNSNNAIQNQQNILTSNQENQDYMANPVVGGIKAGAGILSYGIPVGGAPTLLGKAALGGLAGGLFGAGTARPGQELQGGVSGAVGGAATAGVLGKLFPGATQGGEQAIQNVFDKAPEAATPIEQAQQKALTQAYMDAGLVPKGSVANLSDNFTNVLKTIEDTRLANGLGTNASDLVQAAKIAGQGIQDQIAATPLEATAKDFLGNLSDNVSKYGVDEQSSTKALNNLVDQYATDGTLDSKGAFNLKQATDPISQTIKNDLASGDSQRILAAQTLLKDPQNVAALTANDTARNLLTTANPNLQTPLQNYAMLAQNTKGITNSFINELNPSGSVSRGIGNPLSKGNMIRQGINTVRQGFNNNLVDSTTNNTITGNLAKGGAGLLDTLGKAGSAINNLPNTLPNITRGLPAAGAIPSILGGQAASSISNPSSGSSNLQDPIDPTLPQSLSPNAEPPGTQQSKDLAAKLLGSGLYTMPQIKDVFALKGLPSPTASVSLSQKKNIQQVAGAYNDINTLINQIKQDSSQLGPIMGGKFGDTISGSNVGNRQALKDQFKKISLQVSRITGDQNITNQINMMQDPQTIINNLRDIQQKIYDRYNTVTSGGANLSVSSQ